MANDRTEKMLDSMKRAIDYAASNRPEGFKDIGFVVVVVDKNTGDISWGSTFEADDATAIMAECIVGDAEIQLAEAELEAGASRQ
jgi:hypothetical protein